MRPAKLLKETATDQIAALLVAWDTSFLANFCFSMTPVKPYALPKAAPASQPGQHHEALTDCFLISLYA